MVWQYIKDLFGGICGILALLSLVSFLLSFFPAGKRKAKRWIGKFKPYARYVSPWLVLIIVIIASYSMYENKQNQIDDLQNQIRDIKRVDNPKVRAKAIHYPKSPSPRPSLRLREPANLGKVGLIGISDPNK